MMKIFTIAEYTIITGVRQRDYLEELADCGNTWHENQPTMMEDHRRGRADYGGWRTEAIST